MSRQPAERSERASRIEPLTRLATGGMADIWLSREVGAAGLERLVVVKRLLPHLARDPEIVDMFVSEARFVARLVHPNVVQIHDLGEDDEGYFLVMEYVAGCSVSELLGSAQAADMLLPIEASLCIAEQACSGAHAAHELRDPTGKPLGLVHRDISPHNLMVGPNGEVKLLDFGIAKATAAAEATRTGSVKGKHGYMSPEQCSGAHLDRRSDVFALGIVFWELLTGVRLFKRETEYATMHAIVNGDIRAASAMRPDLPRGLDDVLAKALAVKPEERWQTADALRRALLEAAEEGGMRPSRDSLLATTTALLGARLEERERSLRSAATSGQLPEGFSPRPPDSSSGSGENTSGNDVATVVQGRPPTGSNPSVGEGTTWPRSQPTPTNDEVTHVDPRPPTPPRSDPKPVEAPSDLAAPILPTPEAPPSPARSRTALRWLPIGALLGGAAAAVAIFFGARLLPDPTPSPSTSASSPAPPLPAPPSGPALHFAVAPTVDPAVLRKELAPFMAWLGHRVGRPVELSIPASYDDTGTALATGRAELALLPPLLFVRASAREPRLQPLAVRLFDGSRASDGYMLVRDESKIARPEDLRGHRVCYVDKASTTGFLLPRIWLRKANLVPDKDVDALVSGDHIAAMRDLIAAKCDAAAVYSGAFLTARQEGIAVGKLRVLAITGRVPQDVMVAAPDVAPSDIDKLREALLGFEPHRDIDAGRIGEVLGITGFAPLQVSELELIRQAAEAEGLLPMRDGGP